MVGFAANPEAVPHLEATMISASHTIYAEFDQALG
ncbi:hypothetical protein M728_005597 (plasmid) [Ensifer sp. WSM1721]